MLAVLAKPHITEILPPFDRQNDGFYIYEKCQSPEKKDGAASLWWFEHF